MAHYLVISASSTIGQCVVQKLRAQGHTVFTTARNDNKIVPDAILDASNFEEVSNVFGKAGAIDGVVNCSGSLLLKPAHLTKEEEYHDVINSSLTTAFATVRAAGKTMTKGGSVVLISSSAALLGIPNHEAIAAAKAGINGLVLSAAATYAPMNLRFNAVAPGLVKTALTSSITDNDLSLRLSEAMHPLGRIGSPEEIARAIIFLLDPKNSWITGQIIAVDGGLSTIKQKVRI
ncbi:MAG: 2-deoxy-D-gluconate 3-dehydrogenase [Caedibacter sp. 38-128]|nr:MAG: 2-deoxy-D-gluconate 3-dehydrogenase [Caedibacter sp. 38-128]